MVPLLSLRRTYSQYRVGQTGSRARRVDQAGAKSTNVVSIVGQLRHQEHEIRERISYAPPWERGGMEHHLWEVREQLRGECRGAWRDGE